MTTEDGAKKQQPSGQTRRNVLGLVFLTVFLDMVGFSIIFPLFPKMLEHYLALEGESSLLGRLIATLADWVGEADSERSRFAVTTLFGGLLGSLYSFLQFLFAPVWGGVSDRIGRRPTLLITLFGTAAAHLVWTFAGTFGLLVLSRLVAGLMAGNVSTASAAIADSFEGKERAKGMGMLGAGIGLGFVVGPAIGGLAVGAFDPTEALPELGRFGLNPFSSAALVSFAMAAFNFIWAVRRFPETLDRDSRASGQADAHGKRRLHPFRALREVDLPGVRRANVAYFLYIVVFSGMEFSLTFLAHERFQFGVGQQAMMFVFIGLLLALVQGGLVRRLVPIAGERLLVRIGMALTLPGFVLVGLAKSVAMLYAGNAFFAVGAALVMPCVAALVSRYTPVHRQGISQGILRSLGSLARVFGPIAGGLLYWLLGSWAPYLVGAGVLLAPLWISLKLPDPTSGAAEAGKST